MPSDGPTPNEKLRHRDIPWDKAVKGLRRHLHSLSEGSPLDGAEHWMLKNTVIVIGGPDLWREANHADAE